MKVTVVVDNQVPINVKRPFRGEHGLSLLLETPDGLYLFDAGQSDLIIYNLSLLGVRPADLSAIIISHGHYDHTGGLTAVLTHAKKHLPVYIHADAFLPRFSLAGEQQRFIGIPYSRELLCQLGAEFHYVNAPLQLTSDLWISGPIPRNQAFEADENHFVMQTDTSCLCQDHVEDDIALYRVGADGVTVICGCAHAGIINTLNYGLKVTGLPTVKGLIGGTHLGSASPARQSATISHLHSLNPEFIAANHCTGFSMMQKLAEGFSGKFIPAFVGTVIEF
jgi:7,8-dihydropterin-6-yl-methyl-4-(beta-D-ribofuranosyl)aminobenzene 5'-phosphate synthase